MSYLSNWTSQETKSVSVRRRLPSFESCKLSLRLEVVLLWFLLLLRKACEATCRAPQKWHMKTSLVVESNPAPLEALLLRKRFLSFQCFYKNSSHSVNRMMKIALYNIRSRIISYHCLNDDVKWLWLVFLIRWLMTVTACSINAALHERGRVVERRNSWLMLYLSLIELIDDN